MELLSKRLPKKTVIVDEKPIEVDEVTSTSDLIRASGRNPNNYSIVMEDASGETQLVPYTQRIRVIDGQRFETNLTGRGG
jgi:hypothetical protein